MHHGPWLDGIPRMALDRFQGLLACVCATASIEASRAILWMDLGSYIGVIVVFIFDPMSFGGLTGILGVDYLEHNVVKIQTGHLKLNSQRFLSLR